MNITTTKEKEMPDYTTMPLAELEAARDAAYKKATPNGQYDPALESEFTRYIQLDTLLSRRARNEVSAPRQKKISASR